jgi:GH25 family lysozyme M1 (1,4-beta-N-acetylmuramidase)
MIARLVGAALFLALTAATAQAVYQDGIDVSHFQGAIDWTSVKNAGMTFAFTKATEGVGFTDSTFTTNMSGAMAAGVVIGPYHLARPDSSNTDLNDAANEANYFCDTIQSYYSATNLTLRPVLDMEKLSGTADEKTFLSNWTNNFAATVHSRLGFYPIIYCNSNFAKNYFESNISQYPLWLAKWTNDVNNPPSAFDSGIWNTWRFWQWTSTGSVAGISGNVDRDVFNGTITELNQFIGPQQSVGGIRYSTTGSTYQQNFDSLPKTPENTSLGNTPAGWIDDSTTPAENQFSIEGWYLRHDLSVTEGGASGRQRLRAGTGSSNTGAFYSYGATGSNNRALGSQGSNTIATTPSATPPGYMYMAARLINDTADSLTSFTVTYDGEQWRVGGSVGSPAGTGSETLSFAYSLTATTADWFTSTDYTAVPLLNFTGPQTGSARAIDGTALPGGSSGGLVPNITGTVTGIHWAPGAELWLRWYDSQPANAANNDGLAIDNLRFSANVPEPASLFLLCIGVVGLFLGRQGKR